jgi:hypothetical protein
MPAMPHGISFRLGHIYISTDLLMEDLRKKFLSFYGGEENKTEY